MRTASPRFLISLIVILGISAGISTFADADPTVPTASDVATTTLQGVSTTLVLSGSSNDGGSITFATSTSPSHGTLSALSGSSVTYTPDTSYTGTDSFQFIVTEGATSSVPATATITVSPLPTMDIFLDIETSSTTLYKGSLTVSACPSSQGSSTYTINAYCAIQQSGVASVWDWTYAPAAFITSIGGVGNDYVNNAYWGWWDDLTYGQVALNQHELVSGEHLLIAIGKNPLKLELSPATPVVGATTTATVSRFDFDASYNPVWLPATTSSVHVAGITLAVDASGTAQFVATSTDPLSLFADAAGFISTDVLVVTPTANQSGGSFSGGSNPYAPPAVFDLQRALGYLNSQQHADGSFSTPLITDWSALALSNYPGTARDLLKSYLARSSVALSTVTDFERHAMALEALGLNPYSGSPVDTIAPIVAAYDGTQVGDASLATDDIFALIPLTHAGYTQTDPMIRKIASFVISRQKPDGSWEGGPDVTAAAVQALGPLYTIPGYGAALGKGAGYLATTQASDGGWGNVDSTSWVMAMITSVNEGDPAHAQSWTNSSGKTPANSLASTQQSDGAARPATDPVDTRTWSTAYAIVAASGKSWLSLLQSFPKPANASSFSGGSDPYITASTTATSTPVATDASGNATTTPLIALTSSSTAVAITATSTASTSAAAAPALKPAKKIVKKVSPPTTQNTAPVASSSASAQTASAASAAPQGFWSWLRSIFRRLL